MKFQFVIVSMIISCSVLAQTGNKGTFKVRKRDQDTIVKAELINVLPTGNPPSFIGGDVAVFKYLSENINYPDSAKQNGISGTVYVSFFIDEEGMVRDVTVFRGVNELLDKEAVRVVSSMPKWNPGKIDGKEVSVRYNLPIKFTLK